MLLMTTTTVSGESVLELVMSFNIIYIYIAYYYFCKNQGIFEIEDGFFFENEQHTKLIARVAKIFRLGNVLVVLESNATIFRERGRMHVCV